jgi:hypothetical protein
VKNGQQTLKLQVDEEPAAKLPNIQIRKEWRQGGSLQGEELELEVKRESSITYAANQRKSSAC